MGGGLEVDLSHGAVAAMWRSPGSRLRLVLQVADARHVPDGSGLSPAPEQRYRMDLSDGVHSQPGTLAASLNRLVRDGTLRRGSVVRVLDFVCDYRRRTITVIQLQILQTECTLIGSLKPYEPTRRSREFTTRSVRYALRPDCEPYFGGQHIHQSCIASEAELSANGLSYHGGCGRSSLPGGDSPCSAALSAKPAVWKKVRQIKDEYLGYLDEPDFITVKAVISFVNTERSCSAACPLAVNGNRCNVKAAGNSDGTWHCKLCRQSYETCDYGIWYCKRCGHSFDSCDYGYSVRIQIQDHTGMTFATVYEEAAKEIFGRTARDLFLMEYKEQDYNQLDDIIWVVACKQYVLQLKVEAQLFSDGRPVEVECVVLKAEKVNPSAESRCLLGAGTLLSAGVVANCMLSGGSEDTPARMSSVGLQSNGASTDVVVDSPQKKKSSNMEEYIKTISETMLARSSRGSREHDEIMEVLDMLEQDGVDEGTELYLIATELLRNPFERKAYK